MKKIYIAGKITGDLNYKAKFDGAAALLHELGYNVINPVEICWDIPEDSNWEVYMRRCISELMKCDGVYFLSDWKQSKGARLERMLCVMLDIEVLDVLEGVE